MTAEPQAALIGAIGAAENPFTFQVFSNTLSERLDVVSWTGSEAISELFAFDVRLSMSFATLTKPLEETLLAQPACLAMRLPGQTPRAVHGVIAGFTLESTDDAGLCAQLRVQLVPRLWLLKQRRRSRIFQEATTQEIINQVLGEWQVPCDWNLLNDKPLARPYCTQYQETDYDFVTRLLGEEGIGFFFEPPKKITDALASGGPMPSSGGETERLVLINHAACYRPIPSVGPTMGQSAGAPANTPRRPKLRIDGRATDRDENTITAFALERVIRPKATFVSRPAPHVWGEKIGDAAALEVNPPSSRQLSPHQPSPRQPSPNNERPRLDATAPLSPELLQVYEHAGRAQIAGTSGFAQVALEQLRREAYVGRGQSRTWRLIPGRAFQLTEHAIPSLNHDYVVTAIEHRGVVPALSATPSDALYENSFRCVPAEVSYRPAPPARRLAQVAETALVVGQPGADDIYVDALGRIKVQFHWDIDGDDHDGASCWVPVVQSLAGPAWGTQHIPRVGMQVVVTFLEGNPDQPVVTGCVYNGRNQPPFDLPLDKTRTGIRTRSTPGGRGHNELSFEDAAGHEKVVLHAQRDFSQNTGGDHALSVARNASLSIGGALRETVGSRVEAVYGPKISSVAGDRHEQVIGKHTTAVHGARAITVEGADALSVSESQTVRVAGHQSLSIDGFSSTAVGTRANPTEMLTSVLGKHTTFATDAVRITSEKTIIIECGASRLVIGPEKIAIESKDFALTATETALLKGDGAFVRFTEDEVETAAKRVKHYAEGASLELSRNAALKGDQVDINGDAGAASRLNDDGSERKMRPFKMQLHDDEMRPFAGKKYQLIIAGLRLEGTTDAQGGVDQQVPEDAEVGQITLWIDDYPAGPRIAWPVEVLSDPTPPGDAVEGALTRLRELGYYEADEAGELSAEAEDAIRVFQRDYALEVTGELSDETKAKIKEVYGA